MKKKKIVIVILIIFLVVFMGRKLLNFQVNNSRCPILQDNSCIVYYLLNIDGMKGLGHASFMLVNEQGEGCFYSYNGMQYNLAECLMGKAGIGKM